MAVTTTLWKTICEAWQPTWERVGGSRHFSSRHFSFQLTPQGPAAGASLEGASNYLLEEASDYLLEGASDYLLKGASNYLRTSSKFKYRGLYFLQVSSLA